jgi:hypothetical protein
MEIINGSGAGRPSGWRGKTGLFVGNYDARELFVIIDVVCARCVTIDFDIVSGQPMVAVSVFTISLKGLSEMKLILWTLISIVGIFSAPFFMVRRLR